MRRIRRNSNIIQYCVTYLPNRFNYNSCAIELAVELGLPSCRQFWSPALQPAVTERSYCVEVFPAPAARQAACFERAGRAHARWYVSVPLELHKDVSPQNFKKNVPEYIDEYYVGDVSHKINKNCVRIYWRILCGCILKKLLRCAHHCSSSLADGGSGLCFGGNDGLGPPVLTCVTGDTCNNILNAFVLSPPTGKLSTQLG